MLQPANEATPALALIGFVVQPKAAPVPGWVAMARVTEAFDVIVLPPMS